MGLGLTKLMFSLGVFGAACGDDCGIAGFGLRLVVVVFWPFVARSKYLSGLLIPSVAKID